MHIFTEQCGKRLGKYASPVGGAKITTANIDFRLLLFYSLKLTPDCAANHSTRNGGKLLNSKKPINDLKETMNHFKEQLFETGSC